MRKVLFFLLLASAAYGQRGAVVNQQGRPTSLQLHLAPGAGTSMGLFSPMSSKQNTPMLYYSPTNNRTYVSWVKAPGVGSREGMLTYYDHATKTWAANYSVGIITRNQTDQHQSPSMIVAGDGHILTFEEDGHQTGIRVKRSASAEDLSSFSIVAYLGSSTATTNSDATSAFGYPNVLKTSNGDLYVFVRDNYRQHCYFKSTNNGLTWAAKRTLLEIAPAGYATTSFNSLHWNYTNVLYNPTTGVAYAFVKRMEHVQGVSDNARCYYILKTTDFATWTNISGSFSKNIVTNGNITREELDANCFALGTSVNNWDWCWSEVAFVANSGEAYMVCKDVGSGYKLQYTSGGTLITKSAPWVDTAEATGGYRDSKEFYVHPENENIMDVWADEYISGVMQIKHYRTTDKGDNWVLYEYPTLSTSTPQRYMLMTSNHYEAPEILVIGGYAYDSFNTDMWVNLFRK